MTNEKKKEPLIVFSGGWDSTLMIHHALQEGDCAVISFEHGYHLASSEPEKLARKNVLGWFENNKKMYKGQVVEHIKVQNCVEDEVKPDSLSLAQLYGHLRTLFAEEKSHQYETIRLGLLRTDSSSPVHHLLSGHWQQMWDIFRVGTYSTPTLILPLEHWSKADVIEALPEGLAELVWSCNSPNFIKDRGWVPCGICSSCASLQFYKNEIETLSAREAQMQKSIAQARSILGEESETGTPGESL